MSYQGGDDPLNDPLNDMLNGFMARLRAYLNSTGDEEVIDRILAAATVAAAAVMILWTPNRKVSGFLGFVLGAARQFWGRRKYWYTVVDDKGSPSRSWTHDRSEARDWEE